MRYAKYKKTGIEWLPQVPAEWEVKQLRNFLRLISIKNHPDQQLLSVTREQGVIVRNVTDKEENHNFIPEDLSNYKYVQVGDFVINKMKSWQGSYGVSEYEGIVSPAYYVCKVMGVFKKFFSIAIRSKPYVAYFASYSKGIRVGQWDLSPIALKAIPFLLPPLAEQEKIVKYLDEKCGKIDEAVKAKEREVELLKECKQSLIAEAVTKGVQGKRKMKKTGIEWLPQVPDGWSVVRLKHIVDTPITDGPHETPEFVDEGIPFVSAEASHDGRIFLEECRGVISRELHEQFCKKVRPQRNDIFIVKSGSTTGKTVMVDIDDEFSVWSPLALVRVGKKANCKYVFYFLSSPLFQREVQDNWSFGTQPNIAMGALAQLILPIPPLAEQEKIVKYLDEKCGKIDEAVKAKEREVELLKELKQSVIAETVTGQRKVA